MKNHHWKEMTPKVLAFVTILQVDRFLVSDLAAAAAPSHKALSSKIAHNRYLDLFFEWILFFTPDFKDDHLLWTFHHHHHHSGHICRINEWAHGGQGQVFQKSSCMLVRSDLKKQNWMEWFDLILMGLDAGWRFFFLQKNVYFILWGNITIYFYL